MTRRKSRVILFVAIVASVIVLIAVGMVLSQATLDIRLPSEVWSVEKPSGIATDSFGNVYVSSMWMEKGTHEHGIEKYSPEGKLVARWGSKGKGEGEFQWPQGIAVDPESGDVYVAESTNNRVQKFTDEGKFILSWGVKGTGDGEFSFAYDVAVDGQGNVYVVDSGNDRIQKFDKDGRF